MGLSEFRPTLLPHNFFPYCLCTTLAYKNFLSLFSFERDGQTPFCLRWILFPLLRTYGVRFFFFDLFLSPPQCWTLFIPSLYVLVEHSFFFSCSSRPIEYRFRVFVVFSLYLFYAITVFPPFTVPWPSRFAQWMTKRPLFFAMSHSLTPFLVLTSFLVPPNGSLDPCPILFDGYVSLLEPYLWMCFPVFCWSRLMIR